jgi:hypothetical protein
MLEVVGAFSITKLRQERANCSIQSGNSPLGNLAQQSLEEVPNGMSALIHS